MVRAHPVTFFKDEFFVLFFFIRNFRAKIFKMHYNKSMKKTVLVFCTCLLSAWAGAQSTCETRVDAHPHATTNQRVDYCLNAAYDNIYNNPGLVFSGVTQRHPAAEQPAERATAHNGYFRTGDVAVSQNFVETRQFPKLTDGHVSQQEIWGKRRAVYQGQQLGKDVAQQAACEPQEEKPVVKSAVQETPAGLKARSKKPGRRLQKTDIPQETVLKGVEETVVQEVAPVAAEYTYNVAEAQPYAPAVQDAPEYVPTTPDAQEYTPAEQTAQPYAPYAPAGEEEIPVGVASYAPAN